MCPHKHTSIFILVLTITSFMQHVCNYYNCFKDILLILDRGAACLLGIVLLHGHWERNGLTPPPRIKSLFLTFGLCFACDVGIFGDETNFIYVIAHSLWHIGIWWYILQIPF